MDQLKAFLQSLTSISDEEYKTSESKFSVLCLVKGDFLIEEGQVCRQIAFVNKGSLRTFYLNEKAEEITACFRTEQSLVSSYRSFIWQEPSVLSIEALEDSELTVIAHDDLHELYKTSWAWQNIGRLVAESEYIEMEQYAWVLNSESAKEKYLKLLEEQSDILNKAKVEHIASYLGVTRRTLSRIRQEISV